jgi:hypothetical protein
MRRPRFPPAVVATGAAEEAPRSAGLGAGFRGCHHRHRSLRRGWRQQLGLKRLVANRTTANSDGGLEPKQACVSQWNAQGYTGGTGAGTPLPQWENLLMMMYPNTYNVSGVHPPDPYVNVTKNPSGQCVVTVANPAIDSAMRFTGDGSGQYTVGWQGSTGDLPSGAQQWNAAIDFALALSLQPSALAASGSSSTPTTSSVTASAPASPPQATQTTPGPAPGSANQTLPPATVPPRVSECSQPLTIDQDGNAGPLTCSNGDLNVTAWKYFAKDNGSILALGPGATPAQARKALCGVRNSTRPIEESAYALAQEYYGWRFQLNPTDVLIYGC